MTVRENVQVALLSHHRRIWRFWQPPPSLFVARGRRLLAQVGMADQADRAAGVLAYGDLKRLELGVALANAPRLLLMDEPTAGMAPTERRRADGASPATWPAAAASPCCSPSTTWTWCSASPTASWCSTAAS